MLKIFFEKMLQKNLTFSVQNKKIKKGLHKFFIYAIMSSRIK